MIGGNGVLFLVYLLIMTIVHANLVVGNLSYEGLRLPAPCLLLDARDFPKNGLITVFASYRLSTNNGEKISPLVSTSFD
jgi:hypothetical protein